MRRNIILGAIGLLAVALIAGVVALYRDTSAEPVTTPVKESRENGTESAEPTARVFVETLGYDGHMISAHFVAPGGWVVYWKNSQGEILAIVSEEQPISGVMGIYLTPADSKGVFPELVWGEQRIKGKPIP